MESDSLIPTASEPPRSQPPRAGLPGPAASVKPYASGDDVRPSSPPNSPPNTGSSVIPARPEDDSFERGAMDDALERVLSIALTVHVELGRRKIRVGELLKMGAGQVLELDAAAGAPLSIFANNTLIAEGEAVVVGDRYGVRITDIVSPAERVERLGQGGSQ